MHSFLKCIRCKWVDYLAEDPTRCPVCGSRVVPGQTVFAEETVRCPIMDYRGKTKPVIVTFSMMEDLFDKIMEDDIVKMFPDEEEGYKVIFMMKAYLWTLLKTFPGMWAKMGVPIYGLKQVMTLRLQNPKIFKDIKE